MPSPARKRGKNLIGTSASISPLLELRASATTVTSPTLTEDRFIANPSRRGSNAEKYLDQFRKEVDYIGAIPVALGPGGISSRRGSRASPQSQGTTNAYVPIIHETLSRRNSTHQSYSLASSPVPASILASSSQTASDPAAEFAGVGPSGRPRLSRSPSSQSNGAPSSQYPLDLKDLLDGTHHTDELGVRYEAGWPLLAQYLVAIGEGKGDGDFGRVKIIYH